MHIIIQNNGATLIPNGTINASSHCKICWSVNWTVKGLRPITPDVCVISSGTVFKGRALLL